MMDKQEAFRSLASTAHWTASARAAESKREDRLFNDPWAEDLAGLEGTAWLEAQGGRMAVMVIRTHYFDRYLRDAVENGNIRQVVILAAGLDTRAYRLDWPEGTRVFEIDQEAVLEYKAKVLSAAGAQPACARTAVCADLTADWQPGLLSVGFDPTVPSAWLLEGLLFYLPNEVIQYLLVEVTELAAPGSRIGYDVVNSVTYTSTLTKAWIEMQARAGAPWQGTMDDPEAIMFDIGWHHVYVTQPGAPEANFERWKLPVIPVKMPNMPHNWYVTAVKK